MTIDVFIAVLAAAFMHAGWNAMVKVRLDPFLSISLMSFGMAAFSALCLPFTAVPTGATWIWIVLSVGLHIGYKLFLISAYRKGDLGQAYPLARGTAPLLVALGSAVLLGEIVSPPAAASIATLCLGILLMSVRGASGASGAGGLDRSTVLYALGTSVFVATYTVVDGVGGRIADSALSYTVWLFLLDGSMMVIVCLVVRGRPALATMLPAWRTGLMTGALSLGSYWIVIWAMTQAPIAAVAALRESSILFAIALSSLMLKERLTPWRLSAAALIVAGVVGLRLA